MSELIFTVKECYTEHDMVSSVPEWVDESILDLWNKKSDEQLPGIAEKSAFMLALSFLLDGLTEKTAFTDIKQAVTDIFGKDNIIYAKTEISQQQMQVYIAIFPLHGRVLDSAHWMQNGHLKQEFKKPLLSYIVNKHDGLINKEFAEAVKRESIQFIPDFESVSPWTETDVQETFYNTTESDKSLPIDQPYDRMQQIFLSIYKEFVTTEINAYRMAQAGRKSKKEIHEIIEPKLERNYSGLTENDKNFIYFKMDSAIFSNYILDNLIADPLISDIRVESYDRIRVKVRGKRFTSNFRFLDYEDLDRFVQGLGARYRIDLSSKAAVPYTDRVSSDAYILRYNITTPEINSNLQPQIHIRKTAKSKKSMRTLMDEGMLDETIAAFLIDRAKNSKGIIFTGKGGSGKTTLMNTLIEYIPYGKSVLAIQESEELFADNHPDVTLQHITAQYDLAALARNGLLTDEDYFIIGEIKGAEAWSFLNAADTGHICWSSVHSPSSKDAIRKLADLVMYESKYSSEEAEYMLKELQTIVFMKNYKVWEIAEIVGWDEQAGHLAYKEIFNRDKFLQQAA